MLNFPVHVTGTTGTGRAFINNAQVFNRVEVEFEITAVGATPTVTFSIEGLVPGGTTGTAGDWVTLAVVQADASVATSSAAITVTAVGKTRRYIDGLDKRYFDALAVNVTANTNVTYKSQLNVS